MRTAQVIVCIAILILSHFAFADCLDGEECQPSLEALLDFWQHGHARLAALPQKITKTVDGITFDSDYDNGSLEDVVYAAPGEFNCTIYEEPGVLGPQKCWFRFQMTGVASRTITLNIDHSENPRPVISLDGVSWRRLTASEAPSLYQIVLSFGASENFAELAFFFPYGVAEIYNEVNDIVRGSAFASSQTIGQSYQGRDMWMVTVTDTTVPDTGKHRVWVHSRVHAGEATASPEMLGMLEQVTEDSPLGQRLRHYCIFNIAPLMNVDGVFLGHTRWDSQGYDIERDWCPPVTLPEVLNIKAHVDAFMAGANPIEVALNLHSTRSYFLDTFFFKHVQPSVTAAFEVIQQNYIDAFDNVTPLFDNLSAQTSQLHACQFIESYFWNNWGEDVMAMTHEGHYFYRITDYEWITDDDYRELGHAMMEALVEYFDLPEFPTPTPTPTPTASPTATPTPTPTPTATASPTPSPTPSLTPTPTPVAEFDFDSGPEGWTFRTLPPSDLHTSHWDDASSILVASALGISSPYDESTNYFALWDSLSAAPIPYLADSLYQVDWLFSTNRGTTNAVPSLRFRIGLSNQKAFAYSRVYPGDWLALAQDPATTEYQLFFEPPIEADSLFLAFSLIDWSDDFRGSQPAGEVYLEEVCVYRRDLSSFTNWQSEDLSLAFDTCTSSCSPAYTAPTYTSTADTLALASGIASDRCFGTWDTPLNLFSLDTSKVYRLKSNVSASPQLGGPDLRLRVHTDDYRYAWYTYYVSSYTAGESALPPEAGADCHLYLSLPFVSQLCHLSFDLIDFSDSCGGTLTLNNVELHAHPF